MSGKRSVLKVDGLPIPRGLPTAAAVSVGPFVFVGATGGLQWSPSAAEPSPDRVPLRDVDPITVESRRIYERLAKCLAAGGSSLDSVVQVNQWVPTYFGDVERHSADRDFHGLFFEQWRSVVEPHLRTRDEHIDDQRPASAFLPVDRFLTSSNNVEVEMVGLRSDSGITKQAFSHDVHVPLGGYSIGIVAGPWLFTAGFIASDYRHDGARGQHPDAAVPDFVWYGNRIANEVDVTLRHLKTTVEAGDARWEDTVKAIVYLTPLGFKSLPALEAVWRRYWPESPPARTLVPVSGMGVHPLNVEIMLIVTRSESGADRDVIETSNAVSMMGHAPQAIRSGPLLFLSSQIGRTTDGISRPARAHDRTFPFLGGGIRDQVGRLQENAHAICEAAGTSLDQAVKANLFFTDFVDAGLALHAWADGFAHGYPASGFFETPPAIAEIPGSRLVADLTIAA